MSLADKFTAAHWAMDSTHLEAFIEATAAIDLLPVDPIIDAAIDVEDGEPMGSEVAFDMRGPMMNRVPAIMTAFGVEAVDMAQLSADIRAAGDDENVKRIQLNIDSPGGMVAGLDVLTQSIRDAKAKGTEVVAVVEGMMASAALWAGVQADRIVATELSQIGAIGVYRVLIDTSKAADNAGLSVHVISSGGVKGGGVRGAPLSDEVLADEQRMINDINSIFVKAVAEGRNMPEDEARNLNTGQVFVAKDALSLGLIDEVSNNPQAIMSAPQQETVAMSDYLDLVAKHPKHAALVRDMAGSEASVDDVLAAIEQADTLAEHEAKVVALDAATQRIEALEAEKADAEARIVELEGVAAAATEKADALGAVAETGDDPGHESTPQDKQMAREQFDAMGAIAQAKFYADGGVVSDK